MNPTLSVGKIIGDFCVGKPTCLGKIKLQNETSCYLLKKLTFDHIRFVVEELGKHRREGTHTHTHTHTHTYIYIYIINICFCFCMCFISFYILLQRKTFLFFSLFLYSIQLCMEAVISFISLYWHTHTHTHTHTYTHTDTHTYIYIYIYIWDLMRSLTNFYDQFHVQMNSYSSNWNTPY